MIEITHLNKWYGEEHCAQHVLKNISFTVEQGEYVAITGPSGGGKSTLLSILGLLDHPSQGQYVFFNEEVTSMGVKAQAAFRNQHIGFIFQSFHLLAELSVFDNIALPLLYRNLDKLSIQQKVDAVASQLDLTEKLLHLPHQLSGGQQQRVAVARALVTAPKLLLVDEPTGNLDSKNGEIVMALLDDAHKQGCTIILVTHDLSFASRAERILRICDGELQSCQAG